jgi:hypothetical protein
MKNEVDSTMTKNKQIAGNRFLLFIISSFFERLTVVV